jgi:glycine/D-amino acid oxidase-like deaminating enzyme
MRLDSVSEPPIVVVGAGVVGLAVAYHLVKSGASVTLIDRDPGGDKASFGNAGGIAVTEVVPASAPGALWRALGWMLDPLGPIAVRPRHAPRLIPWLVRFVKSGAPQEVERISRALAAINSRVYDDLVPMLSEMGMAAELHRHGALSIYETEEGYQRDVPEWDCKRSHGIVAEDVSGEDARRMEPALGPLVHRAVLTPQWSHVSDPKRVVQGMSAWLRKGGVAIRTGEVRRILPGSTSPLTVEIAGGERIGAGKAVIAAGAWSANLARCLGDPVLLESERGYNTTLPSSGIVVKRELIFSERKFVATPLSCGLRIGGAAEFGGLKAPPNFKRSRTLAELARRYLPELKIEGGTNWAGHRPTTPDSLPVIGASKHQPNVLYAFGHGHLGLTQAATTGRLVSELVFQRTPSIDLTPYDIGRFS